METWGDLDGGLWTARIWPMWQCFCFEKKWELLEIRVPAVATGSPTTEMRVVPAVGSVCDDIQGKRSLILRK